MIVTLRSPHSAGMNDDRLKMESELLLLKSRHAALLACLLSSVLQVASFFFRECL